MSVLAFLGTRSFSMGILKFCSFISVAMEKKLKQVCSRSSGCPLTVYVYVGVYDHVYTRRR